MSAPRETRCDLSDLPASMCAHCRNQALDFDLSDLEEGVTYEPGEDPGEYGPPFPAQFSGRCSECDQRIREGDTIRACVLGGGYVHGGCAE